MENKSTKRRASRELAGLLEDPSDFAGGRRQRPSRHDDTQTEEPVVDLESTEEIADQGGQRYPLRSHEKQAAHNQASSQHPVDSSTSPVVVTIFSSIPDIAKNLQEHSSSSPLSLCVISDSALGGYGGTVHFDPSLLTPSSRAALQAAVVLIAEPAVVARLLRWDPEALSNLKWCQSTYAGVDPLFCSSALQQLLPLPFAVTRFAGKFGPPMAEWCLGHVIAHERKFAVVASDQRRRAWAGSRHVVTTYRYLSDLTLTILGCGDIGQCIARAAKAFGMRVVGYVKTARDGGGGGGGRSNNAAAATNTTSCIDEYTTDLPKALRAADYLVSVLPSTPETRDLLGGETLAAAGREGGGKSPVFLNVGRGDVIGENAIIGALDKGYISAAILDVFEKEPLPVESALWDRPDVVVSPHVSGVTRAADVPEVFLENYRRYLSGEELLYKVDWSKGY